MSRINIQCSHCGKIIDVPRTPEIPYWVISMGCNFCPSCEDFMNDYYEEWYLPESEPNEPTEQPIPVGENQLTMPFIFDEIGVKEFEHAS